LISLIVAHSINYGIGKDNQLLWQISSDLKKFKSLTTKKTIVMGRKTFDSIGRPLPNRRNIILSRDKNLQIEGVEVFNNIDDVLNIKEDIIICGGSEIYKAFLPFCKTLYVSKVLAEKVADTFFPRLDEDDWSLISSTPYLKNKRDEFSWSFQIWKKKIILNY